jgi:polyphenol oxidase
VRAVFTTRHGGCSAAPFDSLNLGDHVGDAADKVAENRRTLQTAIDARPVFLRQVHGTSSIELQSATPDGQTADACLTATRQLACTVMVADCLPVLFATEDGLLVGAAHAGWRGLAGQGTENAAEKGVLEVFYESFSAVAQGIRARAAIKTIAWLGPCIGPNAFEVGPEVKAAFACGSCESDACFSDLGNGKYLADLPALARLRLRALGIDAVYGNDGSDAWCTVRQPRRFFSHRRDAAPGVNALRSTGRMAACIWLQ